MNSTQKYDVLIVGCGPSGATLANLLRLRNLKVAIFDRDKNIFHAPRAMALDAESCRIYQGMDILNKFLEEDASPFVHHRFVNRHRKFPVSLNFSALEPQLGHPAAGLMFHQPALERYLRDDFSKGIGVEAFLGHEVLEVSNQEQGASLTARNLETGEEHTYRGKFIVGCDGGGTSVCRTAINTKRIDLNYSRKWIVIDVIVHDTDLWNSFAEGSEFRCRPDAAIVFVKGHHNHVRFDFEVTDERAATFNESDAHKLISEYFDTSSIEIIRLAPYNFYAGMPDKWRNGQIFLAGDSAHRTSPFAGQGLNMGIRDAANLAFKFDMVLSGTASERLLDTYEEERWQNCARLIKAASKTGKMISTAKVGGIISRELTFMALRLLGPKMAVKAAIGQTEMPPYTHGFVGTTNRLSGARFIQPKVQNKEGAEVLLDDMIGDQFALISTEYKPGNATKWFQNEFDGRILVMGQNIDDTSGVLGRYFKKHRIQTLLLRPDRYIFDAGTNANALCDAFRNRVKSFAVNSKQ